MAVRKINEPCSLLTVIGTSSFGFASDGAEISS